MFKSTKNEHHERVNEALFYIHTHLGSKLTIDEIAKAVSYSKFHFQRVFKEVTAESVHAYIKRIRLEHAADLLVYNPESKVREVARECGMYSPATFSATFRKHFEMSPYAWRKKAYESYALHAKLDFNDFIIPKIEVKKMPAIHVAYLRHHAYDESIKQAWQTLLAWAEERDISFSKMIGIHHSNPLSTPLKQCRYIASIEIDYKVFQSGKIGITDIPAGYYVSCTYQGKYGEILKLLHYLYGVWLPKSEFEARTTPSYAIYHQNHFLEDNEVFLIDFYMPVRYK